MIRPLLLALPVAALLGACTWVKMEPTGHAIRVAGEAESLGHCDRRGEITVSVRDRVAFYERNELKVRDELEVLARNEAPNLRADTLQPVTAPINGEQRFAAYDCHGAAPAPTQRGADRPPPQTTPLREEPVEVFPLRGD